MKYDLSTDKPSAAPARSGRGLSAVVGLCAALAVLFGAGVYFAQDLRAFWTTADGVLAATAAPLLGVGLGVQDPAVRFSETQVGHVLFMTANSDKCRRVLFDNRTGRSYWADDILCGQTAEQLPAPERPNRLLEVKKSFQR